MHSQRLLLRLFAVTFLAIEPIGGVAYDPDIDKYYPWEAGIEAGLNTDGYELAIHGAWFPVQSIGFKISLGMASEIGDLAQTLLGYDYDDYDYYVTRFKFMPSMEFRSPSLIRFGDSGVRLSLFCNPGVCLSPGAHGSHNPKWFTWQIRGGVALEIDRGVISLGYGYSNFNLFSGWVPDFDGEFHNDFSHHNHSVFLSIAGRF